MSGEALITNVIGQVLCQMHELLHVVWKLILPFHHNLEAGPESLINLHISAIHVNTVETYLLPPATKLGQGNVFTSVCQEFCPQGGSLSQHAPQVT